MGCSNGRWVDGRATFVESPIAGIVYGHVQLNFWMVHEAGLALFPFSEDTMGTDLGGWGSTVPSIVVNSR